VGCGRPGLLFGPVVPRILIELLPQVLTNTTGMTHLEIDFFMSYNSPSCHTSSKVWLLSRNAAVQYSLLSNALFITLVIRWNCSIFFSYGAAAQRGPGPPPSFTRIQHHTQRRTTFGRTPLGEWSARRRDLYLTTHNNHNRQTSMPSVGFEPTVSAGERLQTYALDRAATGTAWTCSVVEWFCLKPMWLGRYNPCFLWYWFKSR